MLGGQCRQCYKAHDEIKKCALTTFSFSKLRGPRNSGDSGPDGDTGKDHSKGKRQRSINENTKLNHSGPISSILKYKRILDESSSVRLGGPEGQQGQCPTDIYCRPPPARHEEDAE